MYKKLSASQNYGEIIKTNRENLGMTQAELARLLGVSLRTVQRLEKSSVVLTHSIFEALGINAFNVITECVDNKLRLLEPQVARQRLRKYVRRLYKNEMSRRNTIKITFERWLWERAYLTLHGYYDIGCHLKPQLYSKYLPKLFDYELLNIV